MANKAKFIVEFDGNNTKVVKAFDGVENKAVSAGKRISSENKRMMNSFDGVITKVAKFGSILLAGVYAFKAAWDISKEAKNAARDAVETESKFNTVFESIRRDAEKTADTFAKSFGVASSTSRKLLSDTGDLLVGFGFTEESALDLSLQVNTLAQDLASFTNYSGGAEGASAALTKAMLGETESVKALGIVLRQNTAEFKEKMSLTMAQQGVSENQARALILLEEAYKQSGKAVGDYARTKNDLANVERRVDEQTKEYLETVGNDLIPLYKTYYTILGSILTALMPVKNAIKDESLEVNALARELANSSTPQEERIRIYGELKEINPSIVSGIDAEAISVDKLTTNLRLYNSELIKRLIIQKNQEKIADVANDMADEQIELTKLRTEAEEALTNALIARTEKKEKFEGTRSEKRLAEDLDKFNKILMSNLTVEEKISALQNERLVGRNTNYWNGLSININRTKNNLEEYGIVFDALTKSIQQKREDLNTPPPRPEIPIPDSLDDLEIVLDGISNKQLKLNNEWQKQSQILKNDIIRDGLSPQSQKLFDLETKAEALRIKYAGVAGAVALINEQLQSAIDKEFEINPSEIQEMGRENIFDSQSDLPQTPQELQFSDTSVMDAYYDNNLLRIAEVSAADMLHYQTMSGNTQAMFGNMASAMYTFYELSGRKSKAAFLAYKVTAIGEAIASTYVAANKALASAPPPWNFILMGTVITAGLANVAKIGGGGGGYSGASYTAPSLPPNYLNNNVNTTNNSTNNSRQITINVTVEGDVVDADAYARDTLIPSINRGLDDGMTLNVGYG